MVVETAPVLVVLYVSTTVHLIGFYDVYRFVQPLIHSQHGAIVKMLETLNRRLNKTQEWEVSLVNDTYISEYYSICDLIMVLSIQMSVMWSSQRPRAGEWPVPTMHSVVLTVVTIADSCFNLTYDGKCWDINVATKFLMTLEAEVRQELLQQCWSFRSK